MTDLASVSTADLLTELSHRGEMPWCACGRWRTYFSTHDSATVGALRCFGCKQPSELCRCR
jgi:hypothetical protein